MTAAGAPLWRRGRTIVAVVGAFIAVALTGTVGWTLMGSHDEPVAAAAPPSASATTTPTPTAGPTSEAPTPSPALSPTPTSAMTPTRTENPVPTSAPTTRPPEAEQPAPVVTQAPDPTCTPSYQGPNAPNDEVRDALVAAGAKQYWVGVQRPTNLVGPLPVITVPANLMKAVAWQESGWQSAIMACDGGIGTMQVMQGTVNQVNSRFGTNYDPHTLKGNTEAGATYIEWLIMYYGAGYFGQNFNLSLSAPVGVGGTELSLLDVVVSAYNVGPKSLEVSGSNELAIPNWQYVNNVEALMTSCQCLTY